jgi:hypothetical protein
VVRRTTSAREPKTTQENKSPRKIEVERGRERELRERYEHNKILPPVFFEKYTLLPSESENENVF